MSEISFVKGLLAQLSNHAINQESLHEDIDTYFHKIECSISSLSAEIDKLWNFVQQLDSVEQELDTKLFNLERKIDFLDSNADAINMWIECVRQTQQLYQESLQPVDTCER